MGKIFNSYEEYHEFRVKKRLEKKAKKDKVKNYLKEHNMPFVDGLHFVEYPTHYVMENAMWKIIVDDEIHIFDKVLKKYLTEDEIS